MLAMVSCVAHNGKGVSDVRISETRLERLCSIDTQKYNLYYHLFTPALEPERVHKLRERVAKFYFMARDCRHYIIRASRGIETHFD